MASRDRAVVGRCALIAALPSASPVAGDPRDRAPMPSRPRTLPSLSTRRVLRPRSAPRSSISTASRSSRRATATGREPDASSGCCARYPADAGRNAERAASSASSIAAMRRTAERADDAAGRLSPSAPAATGRRRPPRRRRRRRCRRRPRCGRPQPDLGPRAAPQRLRSSRSCATRPATASSSARAAPSSAAARAARLPRRPSGSSAGTSSRRPSKATPTSPGTDQENHHPFDAACRGRPPAPHRRGRRGEPPRRRVAGALGASRQLRRCRLPRRRIAGP